ncbi:MAG: N-acetyl-gamma-glutamyl-phosphate reductase [Verrucomicrobiota bacterium]|nr:N-acetyl-gamma-glutamyl-phosphate reductase [Verrucomicrobiota bacterium]
MNKRIGIIGASGYSGEQLVRLLLDHPRVELAAVTSRQHAGKTLESVFRKFAGHPKSGAMRFSEPDARGLARNVDAIFLALPHGAAAEYAGPLLDAGCVVIDLSADFRLKSAQVYREFYGHDHPAPGLLEKSVYGLPEIRREEIRKARLIASPGCYPTSILLPLIPLLKNGLIRHSSVIADALSGVSGAGRKAETDYLFCECHESARPYSVPKHRHLSEIEEQLSLAAGAPVAIQFTPHLVPMNRGILTTLYLEPAAKLTHEAVAACYHDHFAREPFVRLLAGDNLPDTKHVIGTNFIEIAWRLDPRTGRLVVMSALDNLIKGAGGQAVQSMNLVCGFPETAGLVG